MGLAGGSKLEVTTKQPESSVFRIAVFASGNGSNAQHIIDHFNHSNTSKAKVSLIVCNNPRAGILNIARQENIPVLLVGKKQFLQGNGYVDELRAADIRFIVLAGFLWKLPPSLINAFPNHIINIHPALLPSYGGKGMYGLHVHQAVINNKEKESGITIHYVDEIYDHGTVIFKTTCPVYNNDTAELLAQRVQELEHKHYPVVVERLVEKQTA